MVGRTSVDFEVMTQWIETLRRVHWPGPCFTLPEIYAAGAWIGVVPLRNIVVYHALNRADEWDDLLFIDADHKVSTGMVERIEEHAGKYGILGGCYYQRSYPFEIQAVQGGAEEGGFYLLDARVAVPALMSLSSMVIEVAGVGTGCMLIRKDVLIAMNEKRGEGNVFRAQRIPWETQKALIEQGQSPSGIETEDYLFCCDARELLGERTYLDFDPRMETGHVGTETRDRRHYLASHTVPPGANVDHEKLAREGYAVMPMPNRAVRRAAAGKGPKR